MWVRPFDDPKLDFFEVVMVFSVFFVFFKYEKSVKKC